MTAQLTLDIGIRPTAGSGPGDRVFQHAWCGTLVAIPPLDEHKPLRPGRCPNVNCKHPEQDWWEQTLPVGPFVKIPRPEGDSLDDDALRTMIGRHSYPCRTLDGRVSSGWGATGSTTRVKVCDVCGRKAKGKDAGTLTFVEPPLNRCGLCAFRLHLDWCPIAHVLEAPA